MATIKTVQTKKGKVSFLFGVRFITLLQKSLGLKNLEEIGERLQNPSIEDIAVILFAAHENSCFYNRTDLDIENADYMHFFIDEVGMNKVMEVLTDGISELMNIEGTTKKKASPAKRV
ncbi:MAG TPA: hypothetical protein PLV65_02550 [Tenuifilaceae bacterium]|nr:hypothetical protein [Tenuifilaceae bacterium]